MENAEKCYIAIDLKSFYASVECAERGLDPLNTNLVVADPSRTEKTICLAVSPSLKAYGIGGRARLFEVVQRVKEVNAQRKYNAPGRIFSGKSHIDSELKENPSLELDYIVAPPQMAHYMAVSTKIYSLYLKYIAPEDIHVYSIDEVFIDATAYLKTYRLTPRGLAVMLIKSVLKETGITATAGIGTNLYLAKIAMDIVAKHIPADKDGVRAAELDEMSYRKQLWNHTPITDFWRVGKGTAKKLADMYLYTMGDVARCSLGKKTEWYNEDLLYKKFGINAELLIDHAWGYEPCTIADIKAYKPENNSLCSGQVLQSPYSFEKGRLIVREMADLLALDLVEKGLVTDQIVLSVGYDTENLADPDIKSRYQGEITADSYGRQIPKPAHGSINLEFFTCSSKMITEAVTELYERIADPILTVRRMYITANHVTAEDSIDPEPPKQLDLFSDPLEQEQNEKNRQQELEKERSLQKTVVGIKKKYGKNSVLKGMNLEEGATTVERNGQVGGHKA
ncbi:MAG: DNA methylase [Firmicutes bacterium]|nr:DNA methylase [[Eubacterium] siraeum]MCM1489121.1 DNA methylase [Bacillota bacterium]